MTPKEAAKAIDAILTQDTTKMAKAMLLYELGLNRTEAAELVPMNYSQAHTAWVRYHDGGTDSGDAPSRSARVHKQAGVRQVRPNDASDHRRLTTKRALYLTPAQTRYITQDGHEIVRVDKDGGAECLSCGQVVIFDLKWLGFVHTASKSEPTNIEDRYD